MHHVIILKAQFVDEPSVVSSKVTLLVFNSGLSDSIEVRVMVAFSPLHMHCLKHFPEVAFGKLPGKARRACKWVWA